jgi:hypothetical protein
LPSHADSAGLRLPLARRTAEPLRKALGRRLAEAGCSANIIAAILGHKDWREIRRYTAAAEQRGLARQGLAAVAAAFGGEQNTTEHFLGNRFGNELGKGGKSHEKRPKTDY